MHLPFSFASSVPRNVVCALTFHSFHFHFINFKYFYSQIVFIFETLPKKIEIAIKYVEMRGVGRGGEWEE